MSGKGFAPMNLSVLALETRGGNTSEAFAERLTALSNQSVRPLLFDARELGCEMSTLYYNWEKEFEACVDNDTGMGGNSTMLRTPTPWPLNTVILGVIFGVIFLLVGLVGNVMVVLVVTKTRTMHSPTNCYLVSLAVADITVLLSATLPNIVSLFLYIEDFPYGVVGCAFLTFLTYLGVNASALSITAFTIERYVAICHPMKAQTLCTVARAKRIILILWAFSITYCAPWLGLTKLNTAKYVGGIELDDCSLRLDRKTYGIYYTADFIVFYAVPLLLTAVLYVLIARMLFLSRGLSAPKPTVVRKSSRNGEHCFKNKAATSRVQVVKMLVVVVALFAALWLPYRLLVLYNSFVVKMLVVVVALFAALWLPYRLLVLYNSFVDKHFLNLYYILFCRNMIFLNSTINPILYNAMSIKFRTAFRR
ncbi:thyrotropin-releasing hormone receptor-like, partial [Lingula anatina]|uniref:Thyrotropin-releasing hormone receptor n=1 Tax=Lingula anatina TaxID=7574 RepID=A0A1S3K510_LINAN